MKLCKAALKIFLLSLIVCASTSAQKKLIILVRHAEKSASGTQEDMAKGDPDLSTEGRERTERFARLVKKYRPQVIYATDYKRARQTAEPIARLRHLEIQSFDPAKQAELIPLILNGKPKRYLIVGHSNTTPALAGLLLKKDVFKTLPDTEYGVYWVIRTKNGVVTKIEMFPY
jgi:2,3-bisphosphoglycerate-dependent phosphoglycerate mutase